MVNMNKQLSIFEDEGYLQGYSPRDTEERARRENEANMGEISPLSASNGVGGVSVGRTGEQAQRVIDLLSDGFRHSVLDISRRLRIADPRSVIRSIRKSGIVVYDMWETSQNGNRYKSYWIRK